MPLGRIGWRHQFKQRIEDLLELGARVAAEGVVVDGQGFGLVLKLGQPLGQGELGSSLSFFTPRKRVPPQRACAFSSRSAVRRMRARQ
jgi:hypothetical protein